jgi:homoaconitase/3-isopropylmalate dehydratase large subunit
MIKKKLVEKDVEVTVVEKRVIELFEYEGKEYTRNNLENRLMNQATWSCNNAIEKAARDARVVCKWHDVREKLFWNGTYRALYKILDEKMKLIESLDNDVDKD